MARNKFFSVERDDKYNGWWIKERETGVHYAFSSDIHGAINIAAFLEKDRNMKQQER